MFGSCFIEGSFTRVSRHWPALPSPQVFSVSEELPATTASIARLFRAIKSQRTPQKGRKSRITRNQMVPCAYTIGDQRDRRRYERDGANIPELHWRRVGRGGGRTHERRTAIRRPARCSATSRAPPRRTWTARWRRRRRPSRAGGAPPRPSVARSSIASGRCSPSARRRSRASSPARWARCSSRRAATCRKPSTWRTTWPARGGGSSAPSSRQNCRIRRRMACAIRWASSPASRRGTSPPRSQAGRAWRRSSRATPSSSSRRPTRRTRR